MSERDRVIDPREPTQRAPRGGAEGDPSSAQDEPAVAPTELGEAPAARGTVTESGQGAREQRAQGSSSLAGARLAHFQIERLLGRGGMGEVYLAKDLALDRPVALKFLPLEIAQDEQLRERFYREARAQARIQHQNVAHIYFIGEEEGQIFFAMEYIEGESLQDRLDREGTIPAGEAVELCRMAALGLGEAHRHGFTHRDIKPSNLMVDHHGTVKVLDFGIAKQTAGAQPAPAITGEGAGALLGTPLYMSPEQAKGEQVDFRSDIYSLGATLHHLVAGAPPFSGETPMGIVARHLAEPRERLVRRGRRRAPIDELCDRMMEKRPDARFESYDALVSAMERASPKRHRAAGFWVRSFALSLDVFIVMLATVITAVPFALYFEFRYVNVLWAILFALYTVGCHARWGSTFGKRALEIQVVQQNAITPPTLSQAALRFFGQWGLIYLAATAAIVSGAVLGERHVLRQALDGAVMLCVFLMAAEGALTAWRSPYKRTLWDRLSNTEVRYGESSERRPRMLPTPRGRRDPSAP